MLKLVNGFKIYLTESVNEGYTMNERFFLLPAEKQQAIINAGYGTDEKGLFKADEFLEEYISSERVKEYGNH